MDLFCDDDVSECVACGCDDDHACPEGCSWVALNIDIHKGLCSACQDNGLAVLIDTRWSTLNRKCWRSRTVYLGKRVQTETATSKSAAIAMTARKIFGAGTKIVALCDRYSVAIKPGSSTPEKKESSNGRRRRRPFAAAVRRSVNTTASAAGCAGG